MQMFDRRMAPTLLGRDELPIEFPMESGGSSLDLALLLAKHGLPVHPVRQDKRPVLSAWQERASTEPNAIRTMWLEAAGRGHSDALPAIAVPAEFVVIDLDVKRDTEGSVKASGVETFMRCGLSRIDALRSASLIVRSPSGGYHVWFRTPESEDGKPPLVAAPSVNRLEAVDLRGGGRNSYVLAPGARLADGRAYQIVQGSLARLAETPMLPACLLEDLKPRAKTDRQRAAEAAATALTSGQRVDGYLARAASSDRLATRRDRRLMNWTRSLVRAVSEAPKGQRHNTTVRIAYTLGGALAFYEQASDRFGEDFVFQELIEAARANGHLTDDGDDALLAIRDGLRAGREAPMALSDQRSHTQTALTNAHN